MTRGKNSSRFLPESSFASCLHPLRVIITRLKAYESLSCVPREPKEPGDKDFHSPILAVTIVTQQINS